MGVHWFGRVLLVSGLVWLAGCTAGGGGTGGGSTGLDGHGTITGTIRGPVVAGLAVALVGAVEATTVTDGNGNYKFGGVPVGQYHVIPVPTRDAHFTPPRILVSSHDDVRNGNDFVSREPPNIDGFAPTSIGSELWAWGWAGADGSNLARVSGGGGDLISFMADLSGHGRHFFNNTSRKAGYESSLNLGAETLGGAYATNLPLIGIHRYANGSDHFGSIYYQSTELAATAGFYLAVVMTNTREAGTRELFGTDGQHNLRLDQSSGDLYMTLGGFETKLTDGTIPHGALILEIWREDSGRMTVMENGLEASDGSAFVNGRFDVSGFGFDQTGTSYFDDYLMEVVMCDRLPPAPERDQLREYLRVKWGTY
ncbi:MAG: carboxypeptidase regulatory-like domain-containing protein [Planctomycetes bacterium]|nr:carboxypeptidase regulatory-like domain-containing protein [Planctomycetota bacterium]